MHAIICRKARDSRAGSEDAALLENIVDNESSTSLPRLVWPVLLRWHGHQPRGSLLLPPKSHPNNGEMFSAPQPIQHDSCLPGAHL